MREGQQASKSTPRHTWLFCIDSDGCAINSMDIKHQTAFGPAAVEIWPEETKPHEDFLRVWNEINLYTSSRGINRFKGLVMIFEFWKDQGYEVPDFSALKDWASRTPALSPKALEEENLRAPNPIFEMALAWSKRVNEKISALGTDDTPPYPWVSEAISKMATRADVAVVSSANKQAMLREWEHFGLAQHTLVMFGQEDGTKSLAIKRLVESGYDRTHVVMIGDALGDLQAALDNEVWFYPIIPKEEADSWQQLFEKRIEQFTEGAFGSEAQEELIKKFESKLPPTYEKYVF